MYLFENICVSFLHILLAFEWALVLRGGDLSLLFFFFFFPEHTDEK